MSVASFTCPFCGAVSHNRGDIENRYCGRCHRFVDDTVLPTSHVETPMPPVKPPRPEPTGPDMSHNPVSRVLWVPLEKLFANNYNPNAVALMEMRLLYVSIKHDGYTQPIVTIYDAERDRYVIVDGFHRYAIMKRYPDIREKNHGLLPIVVIDKGVNDRMASTIRHNRARGKHSIDGMSALVIQMLGNGWSDRRVCEELGLEKQELIRLKHITGYAKFFAGGDYSPAMETNRQIEERLKHEAE